MHTTRYLAFGLLMALAACATDDLETLDETEEALANGTNVRFQNQGTGLCATGGRPLSEGSIGGAPIVAMLPCGLPGQDWWAEDLGIGKSKLHNWVTGLCLLPTGWGHSVEVNCTYMTSGYPHNGRGIWGVTINPGLRSGWKKDGLCFNKNVSLVDCVGSNANHFWNVWLW